jgi:hypothetical protein
MGRSRSAATTVAFLMRQFGVSLLAAFAHVSVRRDINALNYGFWSQLCDEEVVLSPHVQATCTLPLMQYFLVLERVHSQHRALRRATRTDIVEEFQRQCSLSDEERRVADGGVLGRLVYGLRFVCAELAGRSEHCTVVRSGMRRPLAEAIVSPELWGSSEGLLDGDVS